MPASAPPPTLTVLLLAPDAALEASLQANGLRFTVAAALALAHEHDAVLLAAPTRAALVALVGMPGLTQAAFDSAVVVLAGVADADAETTLLQRGVEAIIAPADGATLLRTLPGASNWLWRDAESGTGGLSEAMVRFAARYEMARTVEDVLARRSRLLFLDAALAKSLAVPVAALLQQETGVDPLTDAFIALCDQYLSLPN